MTPILRWAAGYEVDWAAMPGLIGAGLGIGLSAGILEEIGWRGFLLPHLLKRYRPLVATLILGLIWGGLWHGYADYFGVGDKGWATWPLIALLGPGLLTAWSLILTRVFERTRGNLLLAMLMHTSLSSSALVFGQTYATLGEEVVWTTISVGAAWLAGLAVWVALRQPSTEPRVAADLVTSRNAADGY
jgi:membrane protease YdiL (CAAX protease family)